jgi:hypothetical protein
MGFAALIGSDPFLKIHSDLFRPPLFQQRKIREFSRIEKRASAGRTFFVLDVRLL